MAGDKHFSIEFALNITDADEGTDVVGIFINWEDDEEPVMSWTKQELFNLIVRNSRVNEELVLIIGG